MNLPCSGCGAPTTSLAVEKPFGMSDASPGPAHLGLTAAPGTRHHRLLNTNEAPEDAEIPFIQSVIWNTDSPLAHLDAEILKLQEKLMQLEEERTSLSGYIARNKAILSPIRRIPPEVLGEVFSWTLPSITDALSRGRFDMEASPWVLTQICSRWRAISLSTSSLWSCITID
ncbi:hypothetical protein B0H19DRAFT_982308, partial [Mycena capillaripes]